MSQSSGDLPAAPGYPERGVFRSGQVSPSQSCSDPAAQPGQLLTSVFHWQLSASYWSCLLRVYMYLHFYTPEKGELHSLKLLNPEAQMEL